MSTPNTNFLHKFSSYLIVIVLSLSLIAGACTEDEFFESESHRVALDNFIGDYSIETNSCASRTSTTLSVFRPALEAEYVDLTNFINAGKGSIYAELSANALGLDIPDQKVRYKNATVTLSGSISKSDKGINIHYRLLQVDKVTSCTTIAHSQ